MFNDNRTDIVLTSSLDTTLERNLARLTCVLRVNESTELVKTLGHRAPSYHFGASHL